MRHKKAKQAFDAIGGPLPSLHDLDEEYKKTLMEKRNAYALYRTEREKAKEVLIVQENIKSFYRSVSDRQGKTKRNELQH